MTITTFPSRGSATRPSGPEFAHLTTRRALALASAAVILAMSVAACSSGSKPAHHPSTAPPSVASTPTTSSAPPPAYKAIAGAYQMTQTVTAVDNNPGVTVGHKDTRTWTFVTSCRENPCSGTVRSSSGKTFTFVETGDMVTVTLAMTSDREQCVDDSEHPVPGSYVTVQNVDETYQLTAKRDASGAVKQMTGTHTLSIHYVDATGGCQSDPTGSETASVVITRAA